MGEDGDIFYNTWDNNYRYHTSYGDYIIPSSTLNEYRQFVDRDFLNNEFERRVKKLEEILYDVILDFAEGGLKLIRPSSLLLRSNIEKVIVEKILIEGSDKRTTIDYDPKTHEISGFVWMSLGDRDLTEITDEEVGIIRRALLIWIYENI